MIPKIEPLPKWILTNLQPAFYDTEAVTVLELLSKIYGKIDELVKVVNLQDDVIDDAVKYMKTNLDEIVINLFNEALTHGDLSSEIRITYDDVTESLTIADVLTESAGE